MPSRITKAKQLREKSLAELEAHVLKLRRDTFDTSFKHATRQLEDTASMKHNRRELARTLTVLDELKRGQQAKAK